MPERVLDTQALGFIRVFEETTGAHVKDCLEAEDRVVFLVAPGDILKAVGPGGAVVDRLKDAMHREIQVVEYSDDAATLARNIFYFFSPHDVAVGPKGRGLHATVTVDPAWKARAIGKAGKNLKVARAILLRHTNIQSVSVA